MADAIVTSVSIPTAGVELRGRMTMPGAGRALVVLVHGTGSNSLSARSLFVAEHLQHAGFGCLAFDLLTLEEQQHETRSRIDRFDIAALSARLMGTIEWACALAQVPSAGLFGASTGAAVAFVAASRLPRRVSAVVSRGGRPDLAGDALSRVVAPTLLIVGSQDTRVLQLNRRAAEHLRGPRRLEIVPGASHLFEEPGALLQVTTLASAWFSEHSSS